jgi:hypothetical protein
METKTQAPEQTSAIEKLVPGVEHFKKTFAANRESVDRALQVTKKIIEIAVEDETADQYANNLLVKCNATLTKVSTDRLGSTKILDDAKAWAMGPEKELEAEIERIKKLRNNRAAIIKKAADDNAKAIEMQKRYAAYEGQIKGLMKVNLETGIAKKLSDLETGLAAMFNKATLASITSGQLQKALDSTKPGLKEEFYNGLFTVPYDQNIMSEQKFGDLVARAKAFDAWKFENVNKNYVSTALEVIIKWREKIPQKKIELEKIAKGGEQADKIKAQAEQRAKNEEIQRKEQERANAEEIQRKAVEETQESALTAEFEAQKQTQAIAEQDGVRKKKIYRISPAVEIDVVKLSSLVAKMVLNITTEKGFKDKVGIFKKDKGGAIKLNESGEPEYVEGLQYWLDKISTLGYDPKIEGLIVTEKISTVAKAK